MSRAGIAVTGAGLAIPPGLSVGEAWQRTLAGQAPESHSGRVCVPSFDVAPLLRQPKNQKFMSSPVKCLMRAAKEAVEQAAADLSSYSRGERVGAYVACGRAGPEPNEFFRAFSVATDESGEPNYALLGGRAARLVDPYFPLRSLANSGLALLAIDFGIHGPTNNFGQSDVAGVLALEEAVRDLTERRCDVALVGAYDSLVSSSVYLTFAREGLLAASLDDCRPFDRRSTGLVLGEGAATLVLERAGDAAARSAPILAHIAALHSEYDTSAEFWPHSESDGVVADRALIQAIGAVTADMQPDFVFASGGGVPSRDRSEAAALAIALNETVPVTACKGFTGYLGAATSIVEIVFGIAALHSGVVPPIAGLTHPWPEARLNLVMSAPARLDGASSAVVVTRSWTGQCGVAGIRV